MKIIGGPSTPRSPVCRRPCVSRPGRPHTSWCSDARWYSLGKTTRRTLARCRSRCTSSYSREAGTILRSPSYTGRLQRSRNLYRHVHSASTQLNSYLSRPRLPSTVGIGGGTGQWLGGGTMASAEHESIKRVWGQSPQRGPGAEPLVSGSGGRRSPLKLKAFWSLNVQRSRQI